MYQIRIRRRNGGDKEQVGAPFADHAEAVAAMEALLSERFPNRWKRSPVSPDVWFIDGRNGANLSQVTADGKRWYGDAVTLNVRVSTSTRDGLKAIALEQGLMNPKHPDSPNISAAIDWLVTQYRTEK